MCVYEWIISEGWIENNLRMDRRQFDTIKLTSKIKYIFCWLGAVARSEAWPLGMQAAPSSIPTSGTFFHGVLVMKKISTVILPLPLIQEEQLSVTGERMCTKYW